MLYLLLPSGQICPCSLAPDADQAQALAATLAGLPPGTRTLPIDAPTPELAGLPPECWAWDEGAGALVLGQDLSAAWGPVRQRRDELLAGSDWRVSRAQEQAQLGRPGADAELRELLRWRQALRDLPSAGGDPRDVAWPRAPWVAPDVDEAQRG